MDAATPRRALHGCTVALLWAVLAHGGIGWLVLRGAAAADADPLQPAHVATAVHLVAPRALHPAPRPAAPRGAQLVAQKTAPAAPKSALPAGADKAYRSPRELDRPALPRSSPDISSLEGLPWSGLPTRLRLFVDEYGTVVDVRVLLTHEDEEVVERVRRMFLSTAFIAGRAQGMDVASYKDVELTLGPR